MLDDDAPGWQTALGGAVAFIAHPENGNWSINCSATLVARDRIITSAHCVREVDANNTWYDVPVASRRVGFSYQGFHAGISYGVADIWTWDPTGIEPWGGIAVLRLSEPVPESVVEEVMPVYLGDINVLLDYGMWPIVAGTVKNCRWRSAPARCVWRARRSKRMAALLSGRST